MSWWNNERLNHLQIPKLKFASIPLEEMDDAALMTPEQIEEKYGAPAGPAMSAYFKRWRKVVLKRKEAALDDRPWIRDWSSPDCSKLPYGLGL